VDRKLLADKTITVRNGLQTCTRHGVLLYNRWAASAHRPRLRRQGIRSHKSNCTMSWICCIWASEFYSTNLQLLLDICCKLSTCGSVVQFVFGKGVFRHRTVEHKPSQKGTPIAENVEQQRGI